MTAAREGYSSLCTALMRLSATSRVSASRLSRLQLLRGETARTEQPVIRASGGPRRERCSSTDTEGRFAFISASRLVTAADAGSGTVRQLRLVAVAARRSWQPVRTTWRRPRYTRRRCMWRGGRGCRGPGHTASMTIPSTPDASTAPGLPAIRAPSRPAACSATHTGSLITSSSTAGRRPGSRREMRRSAEAEHSEPAFVHPSQHVLVPVDDRAGDHAGPVGQQEHHELGDLADLPELAHRQRCAGLARQSSPAPWNRRWVASSPSVSVHPMFRPLIRIRSQRCACAALRVSPASPALAATYGAR